MTKKIKGFSKDIEVGKVEEIRAEKIESEWKQDPTGYFLIKINKETKEIEVGFCTNDNKLRKKIVGKHPEEIYYTLLKYNLISSLQHAANIGMELEKAYVALKKNLDYVQDEEIV